MTVAQSVKEIGLLAIAESDHWCNPTTLVDHFPISSGLN
jgi:hypothetical protein